MPPALQRSFLKRGPAMAVGVLALGVSSVSAQDSPATQAQAPQVAGPGTTDSNVAKDAQAAGERIFQLSNTPYTNPAKLGYGSGDFRGGLLLAPNANFRLPLAEWGSRPEDAEIKLGNFYLDFISLSGAVLFSDNANQTELNRKAGAIAIAQFKFAALYQVTENFRLAAGGTITWLPFENEFGITDPLAELDYNLSVGPQALLEMTYTVPLGGWDILLYDRFIATRGDYGLRQNVNLLNRDPDSIEDRIGRYTFREDLVRPGNDTDGLLENRLRRVTEFRNSIGARATRVVPTETQVTLYANHDNSWYSGNSAGLPNSRDNIGVALDSVRENLRFKPFVHYDAQKTDLQREWDHQARAGLHGPITDYIDFLGDAGFTYIGDSDTTSVIWRLRLEHEPRPSLRHALEYTRYVTYPDRDLATTLSYRIDMRLGPYVTAGAIAERSTFEDLDNNNSASTEYRGQAMLLFDLSTRANLRTSVLYSSIDYTDPARADYDLWTGRVELNYQYSDSVIGTLLYQYEQRDSTAPGDSYYENLVLLRMTKTF